MAHRWNEARHFFLLTCSLSGALALGCSDGGAANQEFVTTSGNVLLCGNNPETFGGRELYVRSAIEKKLRDYPDFAADVGMETVSTCAEARDFAQRYIEYSQAHEDFDADQPLGDDDAPRSRLQGGLPPTLEMPKVVNGQPLGLGFGSNPVVRLIPIEARAKPTDPRPPPGGRGCTGTFIAKHWILTAAHCLAVVSTPDTGPPIPPEQRIASDLKGYARWRIEFYDADGTAGWTAEAQSSDIYQYPHKNYMGSRFEQEDVALLFLEADYYDTLLPPSADTGASMRISKKAPLAAPHQNVPTQAVGAGEPDFEQLTGTLPPITRVGRTIFRSTVTSNTNVRFCPGDSGGPAFRYGMSDPDGLGPLPPVQVPIMLGTTIGHFPRHDGCSVAGDTAVWSLVHDKIPFIQKTMRLWKPLAFECETGFVTNSNEADHVRCWGKECSDREDCKDPNDPDNPKMFCSRPGLEFVSKDCPQCRTPGGPAVDCSQCVIGECLPN